MKTVTKQTTGTIAKKRTSTGIHWNAMGAGLMTASLIYPDQQMMLLSMGGSSFIMGLLNRSSSK